MAARILRRIEEGRAASRKVWRLLPQDLGDASHADLPWQPVAAEKVDVPRRGRVIADVGGQAFPNAHCAGDDVGVEHLHLRELLVRSITPSQLGEERMVLCEPGEDVLPKAPDAAIADVHNRHPPFEHANRTESGALAPQRRLGARCSEDLGVRAKNGHGERIGEKQAIEAGRSLLKDLSEAFECDPRGALPGRCAAATIDHHEGIGVVESCERVLVDHST